MCKLSPNISHYLNTVNCGNVAEADIRSKDFSQGLHRRELVCRGAYFRKVFCYAKGTPYDGTSVILHQILGSFNSKTPKKRNLRMEVKEMSQTKYSKANKI